MSSTLDVVMHTGQINLRARAKSAIKAVEKELDLKLPQIPNTSACNAHHLILWLSPDEWLLLTEYSKAQALASKLQVSMLKQPVAITDVSDNRVRLILKGKHCISVLQQGAALDVEALKPGDVVQTLFAKTQMIIQCVSSEEYHLFVRTSFKSYTEQFLQFAMQAKVTAKT